MSGLMLESFLLSSFQNNGGLVLFPLLLTELLLLSADALLLCSSRGILFFTFGDSKLAISVYHEKKYKISKNINPERKHIMQQREMQINITDLLQENSNQLFHLLNRARKYSLDQEF